jgi:hypothetical protein
MMRFEARELNPYAEPVSADDLIEHSVYFALTFIDDEMLIPSLEPVVFVGRNLEAGDEGTLYFQDIDSYRRGLRYRESGEDIHGTFFTGSEEQIDHIFDFESALNVLLVCSLRRKGPGGG